MDIETILSGLTVQELKNIAFRTDLLPPSDHAKKKDWIQAVAGQLRSHPENVRRCLSVEMLMETRLEKGQTFDVDTYMARDDDIAGIDLLHELSLLGLARITTRSIDVAPEVSAVFTFSDKELRALKAAEQLYIRMLGCTRIFGLIESERMGELVLPGAPETRNVLVSIYSCRRGIPGIIRVDGKLWLVDEELENPKKLFEQLNQKHMEEIPWAVYTKAELSEAGLLGIPRMKQVFGRIVSWHKKLGIDLDMTFYDVRSAIAAAQSNDTEEFFSILESWFDEDEIPANFRHAEMEALRSIPIWGFKGHTPRALEQVMAPKTKAPADRGARCPCGSGKRYRSCCGRYQ